MLRLYVLKSQYLQYFLYFFPSELFLQQCRDYAKFKAFTEVMPRYKIPLGPQATGNSQPNGNTQASPNGEAELSGHFDHHRLTPNADPFRAEYRDQYPPLPFREMEGNPPWVSELSSHLDYHRLAPTFGPVRTGSFPFTPDSRTHFSKHGRDQFPRGRGRHRRGRNHGLRGRGSYGRGGHGRGQSSSSHPSQTRFREKELEISTLRKEVAALKRAVVNPTKKGEPKVKSVTETVAKETVAKETVTKAPVAKEAVEKAPVVKAPDPEHITDRSLMSTIEQQIDDLSKGPFAGEPKEDTIVETEANTIGLAGLNLGPEKGKLFFDSHLHLDRLIKDKSGLKSNKCVSF